MKKIIFVFGLLMMLFVSIPINATYPKLEVKATAVAESEAGKKDAKIQLTTEGERPPYKYQLFNKAPWDGGKEIDSSEKTYDLVYVFENLSPGKYFVCVTDSEENSDCEIIEIK